MMGEGTAKLPTKERLVLGRDYQDRLDGEAGRSEGGKPADKPEQPEPLDAKEEQVCADLAAILLEDAAKDLQRRYNAGVRLREAYPDGIQARGKEVIKQAADRCGLHPSDLYRMRTFAKTFASFEVFVGKYPDAKTWSKVKEVLADENKKAKKATTSNENETGAAKAKKKAAKENQERERTKKEVITLLQDLSKKIKNVPFTRLMFEEAQDIEEAFEEISLALTPLVGPIKAIRSAINKDKNPPDQAAQ